MMIIAGCNSKGNNFRHELSEERLIKLEFEKLKISVKVPEEHLLFEDSNCITIHLNSQGRRAKEFSITKSSPDIQKNKYKESFYFDNGAIMYYYTFAEVGGSGGVEYYLEGIFEFEKERFLITSIEQREFGKGRPEFCMRYLSTVEKLKPLPLKDKMN